MTDDEQVHRLRAEAREGEDEQEVERPGGHGEDRSTVEEVAAVWEGEEEDFEAEEKEEVKFEIEQWLKAQELAEAATERTVSFARPRNAADIALRQQREQAEYGLGSIRGFSHTGVNNRRGPSR